MVLQPAGSRNRGPVPVPSHDILAITAMSDEDRTERFRRTMLPHLQAAYNLARWLARNDSDAEDVVQEAICAR